VRKEIVQTYNRLEMEGNDETKKENAVDTSVILKTRERITAITNEDQA
tara:strand:+ start:357 stop:500 length:144 start_codon:yes stop_codon:yes gene_type:complete